MRFQSRVMEVAGVKIGGVEPVAVQSMTTTDTMNVAATVSQVKALHDVGCDVVRITAPTVNDAEALREIVECVRKEGCQTPIVADIHFLPKAAFIAAEHVNKVRINPGNFADRKMFKVREYTDDQYQEELKRIEEKFGPLVDLIKSKNKALRIGTNHGSLSDRILNRFGDTPEGMIESAFEYAQVCRDRDFHNFCFSMKASNVGVMVKAYRMLADRQKERGWDYPIHLGVTEAGDGEDARIKSAIGIGSLLAEGIGDTIRVSLTESPLNEVPVGRAIARRFPKDVDPIPRAYDLSPEAKDFSDLPFVALASQNFQDLGAGLRETDLRPDVLYWKGDFESIDLLKDQLLRLVGNQDLKIALPKESFFKLSEEQQEKVELFFSSEKEAHPKAFTLSGGIEHLKASKQINPSQMIFSYTLPQSFDGDELARLIESSFQVGTPFLDLGAAGILLEGFEAREALSLSFGILQATRRRMSKTEYIACPSCGRTLFDLEETTARIKKVTSHLKGVKIAVMGCIVNGPGEMADADFGYVGGAPGRVNLYVEKDCVERNIEAAEAPQRLVELIKKHGKWVEPEPERQAG